MSTTANVSIIFSKHKMFHFGILMSLKTDLHLLLIIFTALGVYLMNLKELFSLLISS